MDYNIQNKEDRVLQAIENLNYFMKNYTKVNSEEQGIIYEISITLIDNLLNLTCDDLLSFQDKMNKKIYNM